MPQIPFSKTGLICFSFVTIAVSQITKNRNRKDEHRNGYEVYNTNQQRH